MKLVGSSPPPRGPDDGSSQADSPHGDGHDAAPRGAPGEEESGWVAPGEDESGWVAPGAERTSRGQEPGPSSRPGEASPWSGWQSPGSGQGQEPGLGEPSPWQGWESSAPTAGQGQREAPPQGDPSPWSGGGAPAWGPPPQPTWGANAGWGSPGYQAPVLLPKGGSARTGPLPLHPMSFSDVLDGAFRLLRANLATIVLVTAVFFVPLELISAFLSRDLFGGQSILQVLQDPSLTEQEFGGGLSGLELGGTVGTALLGLLITPLVGGAITQVVAASYLGQQLSAGDALRTTGRRVWALLGAAIFVHVVEAVGFVLCVLPALVAMAFLICTIPAVVIERLGPIKSMRRSFALVRPRFWAVLGIAVVSGLLATLLKSVLGSPFTFGAQLVGLRWGFILLAIGAIVPALLASPFVSIVATLVYFDARIRHEGFDLQMIARGLADGDAPAR
jgi:hypothetical protein